MKKIGLPENGTKRSFCEAKTERSFQVAFCHQPIEQPKQKTFVLQRRFSIWLTERGQTILGMIMVRGRMYQIKCHKKTKHVLKN